MFFYGYSICLYSVLVPVIIHVKSYNIGPRYNGIRLYFE